jgi:hypothetical protein
MSKDKPILSSIEKIQDIISTYEQRSERFRNRIPNTLPRQPTVPKQVIIPFIAESCHLTMFPEHDKFYHVIRKETQMIDISSSEMNHPNWPFSVKSPCHCKQKLPPGAIFTTETTTIKTYNTPIGPFPKGTRDFLHLYASHMANVEIHLRDRSATHNYIQPNPEITSYLHQDGHYTIRQVRQIQH